MKKTNAFFRSAYLLFSVFMIAVFGLGIRSFIVVPPLAKAEAEEIERMLRQKQEEEAERLRLAREEALRLQQEHLSQDKNDARKLQQKYRDSVEMNVVGIGDSVMLAALSALYEEFPNGYFDAVFGRTLYEGLDTIYDLENSDALGDVVVYSLVTNCYIEEEDIENIIAHSGGRPTFWITTYGVANDSNAKMRRVIPKHDDAFLVEWEDLAMKHRGEWILPDGLHPNEAGSKAYAELIRQTINNSVLRRVENNGRLEIE